MMRALLALVTAALLTYIACDRHAGAAEPSPGCGAAELAQAQRDLATGAHLLASPDPVTSLFGLQIMKSAEQTVTATRAACASPVPKRTAPPVVDPWEQTEPASKVLPPKTWGELEEEYRLEMDALVLGCAATPAEVRKARANLEAGAR
jgi:uncharacterized protein (DUF1800 family)